MKFPFGGWIAAVVASSLPGLAAAQDARPFPSKPVTVIITTAPGSSTDTEVRLYTQKLTQNTGQTFLVDFKVGAGQVIGTNFVAKSAPDGYTILTMAGAYIYLPAFSATPPYDPVRDFAPISLMSTRPTMFVVHPSMPVKTMQEYIAYARTNPGKINFGTTGKGGSYHMMGALLHSSTNTEVTFVHYSGGGPMWIDAYAGRLDAAPSTFLMNLQAVKAGKMRALANLGSERSPSLPDLRTMDELGYPGIEWINWLGFGVPAKTSPAIVARLNTEFVKAGKAPDVTQRLAEQGGVMVASTPEYFAKVVATETARWRKVVVDNNLKLEE